MKFIRFGGFILITKWKQNRKKAKQHSSIVSFFYADILYFGIGSVEPEASHESWGKCPLR